MYAYTSSLLHTAILRLFTRCECILPNLFVGVLTRESVSGALSCGLSADQIVLYLRQHAHPHVAARSPVVPEVSWPCEGPRASLDSESEPACFHCIFPAQSPANGWNTIENVGHF